MRNGTVYALIGKRLVVKRQDQTSYDHQDWDEERGYNTASGKQRPEDRFV
jgi:hypothetical protein